MLVNFAGTFVSILILIATSASKPIKVDFKSHIFFCQGTLMMSGECTERRPGRRVWMAEFFSSTQKLEYPG